MRWFREIGIIVLIAVAVFALLRVTLQGYTVQYSCMLPNIEDGEWVMVSKASYFFSDPERGEVVVFDPPNDSEFPYIKRIIGLPGETVEVKDGKVLINNVAIDESYIKEPPHYTMAAREIPADEYFVLGDNRNNANDSHRGWTVPRDSIIGKAWFVYWPPGKWQLVKHYSYPELAEVGGLEASNLQCSWGV
jgi:signal peptidase I